jgi:hypothetical protein
MEHLLTGISAARIEALTVPFDRALPGLALLHQPRTRWRIGSLPMPGRAAAVSPSGISFPESVRSLALASLTEGCVADDELGQRPSPKLPRRRRRCSGVPMPPIELRESTATSRSVSEYPPPFEPAALPPPRRGCRGRPEPPTSIDAAALPPQSVMSPGGTPCCLENRGLARRFSEQSVMSPEGHPRMEENRRVAGRFSEQSYPGGGLGGGRRGPLRRN